MKNTACRPKIVVSADGSGIVSQAGALLLTQVLRVTGLGRQLSAGLVRWRAPRAIHDPGKIVADLAVALALGGDCLADVAVLRAEPELFGPVISRLVSQLAGDAPRALKAIRTARAAARERAWALAGQKAPGAGGGLIPVDIDATIVIAHSPEGAGGPHPEENVRPSPADGVRRPWRRRVRGAAGHHAAAGERRVEHRRGARPGDPVPLENRIRVVTCGSSGYQAARAYWLIRPPRTGFRRIRSR